MSDLAFSHVGVCCSDLERSTDFYRALGFNEVFTMELGDEVAATMEQTQGGIRSSRECWPVVTSGSNSSTGGAEARSDHPPGDDRARNDPPVLPGR